jgi:hypothetical protein
MIFGTHSFDTNLTAEYLTTVINYIKSLNVPILTLGEALKLKGNVLSVGEFTSNKKFYVGSDGTVIMGS